MKNITFITTGQPTTNPRLVKEAETLRENGYHVTVIYSYYSAWAQQFDQHIIAKYPSTYVLCGGSPVGEKVLYLKSRLLQKISTLLFKMTRGFGVPEQAISRTHLAALSAAKKTKTDLYIAHNLGALPAAVLAAKHNKVKVGYDAEDMHSAQYTDRSETGYLLNKYIEEKYLPHVDYFSVASPLIGLNYKKAYPGLNPLLINNVFPASELPVKSLSDSSKALKLFWFSQTIGEGRGLEQVIGAMSGLSELVELHLLGSCTENVAGYVIKIAHEAGLKPHQLQFHKPVAANEIIKFAAQFDIGMAAETGIPFNRDICLTNKIFTYVQAGLTIIASDTQAQTAFLNQYSQTGKLYQRNNDRSLAAVIDHYIHNRDELYNTQKNNYTLGQTTLNWENESKIFTTLVNQTLNN